MFFYGLFMDEELLKEQGLQPGPPEIACLDGFSLRIGERATLVKTEDGQVWGTVMALQACELEALYSDSSVSDYRPEAVVATAHSGETLPCLVYNLPPNRLLGQNRDYLEKLIITSRKAGVPAFYTSELEARYEAIAD